MAAMSLRQYARHRGVSLAAVQKAIQSGRIAKLPDGQVESEAADVDWERNTATYAPAVTRPSRLEEDDGAIAGGASQYTRARAVREHYQARLAKIDYEERVGKLVSKDEVQVSAFNKFRQFRNQLLNLPDRVASMLAAENDAAKVHEILSTEVRQVLNEFADSNS
jgi:pyruvate/2-oxoglutarate dehydrogenase complex dihydrolipoamide acyltransferase (E2) component